MPNWVTTGVSATAALPEDHPPLGQALGPGRTDVVLAEHLEHRPAGQPGVGRRRDQGQGHPGQDQARNHSRGLAERM